MTRSNGEDHDSHADDGPPKPGEMIVVATDNGDTAENDK
jgi:hypothetical protein